MRPRQEARGREQPDATRLRRALDAREGPARGSAGAALLGTALISLLVACGREGEPSEALPPSGDAPAAVTLPARADAPVRVALDRFAMSVEISLRGARPVPAVYEGASLRFAGALGPGSALELRTLRAGFEDLVTLPSPPPGGALRYDVLLSGVAGLRLVGGALELLDRQGAPRLRMAPPHADDATGERHRLPVDVEGCAVDHDPSPPWGRSVVDPGSYRCAIVVHVGAVEPTRGYPLVVDPVWTATSDMIEARTSHAAVRLASGRALVVGVDEGGLTGAELYDPSSGSFAAVGPVAQLRTSPEVAVLGGGDRALVTGGRPACLTCGALATAEVFDEASGSFTTVGSLSTPRVQHAVTTLQDGRVLVVGGNTGEAGAPHLGSSELFDPSTASFAPGPDLATPRSLATVTTLADGSALVVGGAPGAKVTERLAPGAATFTPSGSLAERRLDHDALLLPSGHVLVVGGRAPSTVSAVVAVEVFDPTAPPDRAWTLTSELLSPHDGGTAALLGGGRVLVAGGCCASAAAELYDPARGAWSSTALMTSGRFGHVGVVVGEAAVLVAGGSQGGAPSSSAEVFTLTATGEPCLDAIGCASGYCVDGVCCDAACDAACRGCSAASKGFEADGACEAVGSSRPDPRGVCEASAGECGLTGQCDGAAGCEIVPSGSPCGAEDCPSGVGACTEEGTCTCAPETCSEDGRHLGASDCAPYRCREGSCLTACRTSTECASGFVCSVSGRCTSPPLPPPTLGCGCAVPADHAPRFGAALAGVLLCLALRLPRRRPR